MQNKLFLAFAAVLFSAITVFNLNLSQQESAGDITLAGVEMVAGAVDYEIDLPTITIRCSMWPPGRCWRPFAFGCCYWTGWQEDYCSGSMPC